MQIRNYEYHTYDLVEEYVYEIEEQMYVENEIYIRKQLPVDFKNYETEKDLASLHLHRLMSKEHELISYAYEVLDVDYNTYRQIQTDVETMINKYYIDQYIDQDDIYEDYSEGLYDAIENRDIKKAKTALVNTTVSFKKFNTAYNQFEVEYNTYKTNLTVKFTSKVKK